MKLSGLETSYEPLSCDRVTLETGQGLQVMAEMSRKIVLGLEKHEGALKPTEMSLHMRLAESQHVVNWSPRHSRFPEGGTLR